MGAKIDERDTFLDFDERFEDTESIDDEAELIATIVPSFDPVEYARELERRHEAPTMTNEVELELARLASIAPHRLARGGSLTPRAYVDGGDVLESGYVEVAAPQEPDEERENRWERGPHDWAGDDEQLARLRAKLSPLTRVPSLARPLVELGALLTDPEMAYVVGFVDGVLPLEMVLDVTGLSELAVLRTIDRMVTRGIVIFRAA